MNRHPGPRALRFARRWFGRGAATRIFEPLIADWQHDVRCQTTRLARLGASTRGRFTLASTMIVVAVQRLIQSRTAVTAVAQPALLLLALGAQEWWRRRGYPPSIAGLMTAAHIISVLPLMAMWVCRAHRRLATAWSIVAISAVGAVVAELAIEGWLLPGAFRRQLNTSGVTSTLSAWPLPQLFAHDASRAWAEGYRRLATISMPVWFGATAVAAMRQAGRQHDRVAVRVFLGWSLAMLGATLGATRAAPALGASPLTARWTAPLVVSALVAVASLAVAEARRRRRIMAHRPRTHSEPAPGGRLA